MTFTQDYIHGRTGDWLFWLGHLIDNPSAGLEIGAFEGRSAAWMLQNIFTHPDATYTVVDTFEGSAEHHAAGIDCAGLELRCRENLAGFAGARVIKGDSALVLRGLLGEAFDFVYVDGAHDARSVLRDAVLAFEVLKPGGVLCFDDYEWNGGGGPLDRPKVAVNAFLDCYERQVEIIGVGWQVAVRKRS